MTNGSSGLRGAANTRLALCKTHAELGHGPCEDLVHADLVLEPRQRRTSRKLCAASRKLHARRTLVPLQDASASMMKAKVAAIKVHPSTVLSEIERLCELANLRDALAPHTPTMLKDNISWHYPF